MRRSKKRGNKPVRERQNGIDRAVEILDALLRLQRARKDRRSRQTDRRAALDALFDRQPADRGRHPRSGRATKARSISARRCTSMAGPMPTPIRCTGAAGKRSTGLPRRPMRRRNCARCAATNMWSSTCVTVRVSSRSRPISGSRFRSRGRLRAAFCSITCRQATSCGSCRRKTSACRTAACSMPTLSSPISRAPAPRDAA